MLLDICLQLVFANRTFLLYLAFYRTVVYSIATAFLPLFFFVAKNVGLYLQYQYECGSACVIFSRVFAPFRIIK